MCEINSLPTKLIFINKLCFSTMHRVYIAEWCIQFLLSLSLLIPIPALLSDLDCKRLLFEYWLCDRNEITEHLTKKNQSKYLSFFYSNRCTVKYIITYLYFFVLLYTLYTLERKKIRIPHAIYAKLWMLMKHVNECYWGNACWQCRC